MVAGIKTVLLNSNTIARINHIFAMLNNRPLREG